MMKVINKNKKMQGITNQLKQKGHKIGLIPTMGFLHEGHLSLIRKIKTNCDTSIVSIFVNPTQFGPAEDFDNYPRDFTHDEKLCIQENVNFIFYPPIEEMYHKDHKTFVITEDLSKKLCGITRPHHFKGVTTIVTKLFNIVKPDVAIFGQKDAQQYIILKKMVSDLNFDIEMMMAPIVRESDGLAMSSRNKYLNPEERKNAIILYQCVQLAEKMIRNGVTNANKIKNEMKLLIDSNPGVSLDYLAIVDISTLEQVEIIQNETLIALAVFIGKTRLIDNIII